MANKFKDVYKTLQKGRKNVWFFLNHARSLLGRSVDESDVYRRDARGLFFARGEHKCCAPPVVEKGRQTEKKGRNVWMSNEYWWRSSQSHQRLARGGEWVLRFLGTPWSHSVRRMVAVSHGLHDWWVKENRGARESDWRKERTNSERQFDSEERSKWWMLWLFL